MDRKMLKLPLEACQIIKSHRHYRIYQHVKPNLCQTLQIQEVWRETGGNTRSRFGKTWKLRKRIWRLRKRSKWRWDVWTQSQRAVRKRLVYKNDSIFQQKNGKMESSVRWWQWGLHRYRGDWESRNCFTWLTLATCIFCWKFNQNFLLFLFYEKTSSCMYKMPF